LPNQDLIENIERICVEYGIQYGVIVSAIGSLRQVSLNVVTRTTPKPPNGHMEHVTLEGPFSLLAGQGVIAPAEDPEKRDVHFTSGAGREG
jgi:predicted DNA-binding protein with PD1-like motif